MTRKFFGTDGVRGEANSHPMTAEMALRLGMAVGEYFQNDPRKHRVVIGKDTRRSGYMIEHALTAGLTSVGMDVYLLGPVPTPAVGMLTRSLRADLGVMISASLRSIAAFAIRSFVISFVLIERGHKKNGPAARWYFPVERCPVSGRARRC